MGNIFKTLKERWKAKTPRIFKNIMRIAIAISSIAVAVQTSLSSNGVSLGECWEAIYPYIVAFGAGAATVAKLTQQYDKDGNPIDGSDE